MGVLNVTPDSFSDGGKYEPLEKALNRAQSFVQAGATFIDIGGESSRPGALPIPVDVEIARVLPLIAELSDRYSDEVVISIDTRNRKTAEKAVQAGATLVNDISAFSYDPTMIDFMAESGVGIALMHAKDNPETMSWSTDGDAAQKYVYDDVVDEVHQYLQKRKDVALNAGVNEESIILDIGLGFGKTASQNFKLIREIDRFSDLGSPLLVGASRKSFLGEKGDNSGSDRLIPSLGVVFWCAERNVDILRVHDVEESISLLNLLSKIRKAQN